MSLVSKFSEYFSINKGRSSKTTSKYCQALPRLCVFLDAKGVELTQASRDDLIEFTGAYCWQVLKMTSAARKPVIAAVKAFYEWAHTNGYVSTNPADSLEYPKLGRRLPNVLALHNLERMMAQPDLSEFTGLRDLTIMATLAGTGFRVGGLVSLNQSALIQFQDHKGNERIAIRVIEKGDKERMIPIPMELQLLLIAYISHPLLKEIDRTTEMGDQVLFVSTKNHMVPAWEYAGEARRLSDRSVDKMLKRYGELAGIPVDQLHAHAIRHLFGTELAEDDVDDTNRKDFMGHSSVDTVEIYTHLAMRKKAKLMDKANPLGKIHTPVTAMLNKMPRLTSPQ
jgi:integrase/recombinase XerC/integrase/recombinase XerD